MSNHWASIPACSVVPSIYKESFLTTYRTFTVATVRFTQNVSCNICTHPRYQQVANVSLCNNSSDNKKLLNTQGRCQSICTCHHCHIYAPITAFVTFTPYKFHGAPRTLTWQSRDLVRCNLYGLPASNNSRRRIGNLTPR